MRFRSLLWLCLAVPALSFGGCSCDPSIGGPVVPPDMDSCNTCFMNGVEICAPPVTGDLCPESVTGYKFGICPSFGATLNTATCEWTCGDPAGSSCIPPNEPGYMARYLDSVAVTDGAGGEFIAISGYSPGWLDSGNVAWPYGDLVYSEFTPGDPEVVSYTILDGKPADTVDTVTRSPMAWRGGNTEPGDDVGKYSSIAATAAGDIYIAYSDFTPGAFALKMAHRAPGATTFTVSVVDDSSLVQTGGAFYPSIAIWNGMPVIAYGVREAALSVGTQPHGWVRVATATSATPADSTGWVNEERADSVSDIGCVNGDSLCASGDRCVTSGTSGRGICVTPSTACAPACAGGMFGTVTLCADIGGTPTCASVKSGGDLVDAQGMFNQLVVEGTGLALVYHDRSAGQHTGLTCETTNNAIPPVAGAFSCVQRGNAQAFCQGATADVPNDNDGECLVPNGNLWAARRAADGTWSSRFLIDGYSRKDPLVGDSGQHVSIVIDASGVWHLAYLDGSFDRIRYARVAAGATVATTFGIVDDGTPAPATRPTDRVDGRRRLVGGDISIGLSAAGELRILYQDMTGPENLDPTIIGTGTQPLLATRSSTAIAIAPWTVVVPTTNAPNSGWWTTQATGLVTPGTSYCVWAQREANSNDPDVLAENHKAETHALACDAD
jgi:hypothetical protein